ncbi:MAG: nucleotide exchange factor GrpE [Bacteroidetes bacterium]|nr:nucleotide exchange factor GrpE [Bacteroidota bacterium]
MKDNDEMFQEKEATVTDKESQNTPEEKSEQNEKIEEKEKGVKEPTSEEKCGILNDKLLRLHAEFDNYRKRTIKERIELSKTASEDVIKSLLPVIDDMERAIKSQETNTEANAMIEGICLIYQKLKNILSQKGVEEINATGETFNTDFHEALSNIPAECDDMKGKVVDVLEKGYMLNGKVIRFAKVVVGN